VTDCATLSDITTGEPDGSNVYLGIIDSLPKIACVQFSINVPTVVRADFSINQFGIVSAAVPETSSLFCSRQQKGSADFARAAESQNRRTAK
jgi:hypothetical protein